MNNQAIGQAGESATISLLQKDNFVILEKNYKKFFGEIDIIAQQDNIIASIEVKTRKQSKTSMFELVTPQKQRKITLVAQEYIAKKQLENVIYRFGVALVIWKNNSASDITYIPNAFCPKE